MATSVVYGANSTSSFQAEQALALLKELKDSRGHLYPLRVFVWVPFSKELAKLLLPLFFWLYIL